MFDDDEPKQKGTSVRNKYIHKKTDNKDTATRDTQ